MTTGAVSQISLAAEYNRQYLNWVARQGAQALDLRWRLRHLLWRHRELIRRYPPVGKRVLDYGCMDGVFTIRLQQLGAQAVGYDISPAAIDQAIRFRGLAQHPIFSTIQPMTRQFDMIYCSEVVEHVEDDRAFIGELITFLAPGGVLVGTTPVGRSFWDPDHKRVYDPTSLAQALQPWGSVQIRKFYRNPIRNLLPFGKAGAAVFIFEVRPPSLPDAR